MAKVFVKVSLEGWRYDFAHREEALDIVIEYMREAQVLANGYNRNGCLTDARSDHARLYEQTGILRRRITKRLVEQCAKMVLLEL